MKDGNDRMALCLALGSCVGSVAMTLFSMHGLVTWGAVVLAVCMMAGMLSGMSMRDQDKEDGA